MTNQCCSCFAIFSQLNERGRCPKCSSDSVALIHNQPSRELHRERSYTVENGRVSVDGIPGLTFSNKTDALRFCERIIRAEARRSR